MASPLRSPCIFNLYLKDNSSRAKEYKMLLWQSCNAFIFWIDVLTLVTSDARLKPKLGLVHNKLHARLTIFYSA